MSGSRGDPEPGPPGHEHLVEQLRDALGRASELVARLSSTLATAARAPEEPEPAAPPPEVERQLSAARLDVQELSERLVDTEHQLDRLMGLYVASYQLHSYLEPKQVHGAILA